MSTAFFIDLENCTSGKGFEADSCQVDFRKTMKVLETECGPITLAAAYAYVNPRTGAIVDELHKANIMIRDVPGKRQHLSHNRVEKDAADFQIAVDAVELAVTRPDIDCFALLSQDNGFYALANKLQELGKRVYVVLRPKTYISQQYFNRVGSRMVWYVENTALPVGEAAGSGTGQSETASPADDVASAAPSSDAGVSSAASGAADQPTDDQVIAQQRPVDRPTPARANPVKPVDGPTPAWVSSARPAGAPAPTQLSARFSALQKRRLSGWPSTPPREIEEMEAHRFPLDGGWERYCTMITGLFDGELGGYVRDQRSAGLGFDLVERAILHLIQTQKKPVDFGFETMKDIVLFALPAGFRLVARETVAQGELTLQDFVVGAEFIDDTMQVKPALTVAELGEYPYFNFAVGVPAPLDVCMYVADWLSAAKGPVNPHQCYTALRSKDVRFDDIVQGFNVIQNYGFLDISRPTSPQGLLISRGPSRETFNRVQAAAEMAVWEAGSEPETGKTYEKHGEYSELAFLERLQQVVTTKAQRRNWPVGEKTGLILEQIAVRIESLQGALKDGQSGQTTAEDELPLLISRGSRPVDDRRNSDSQGDLGAPAWHTWDSLPDWEA